MISALSYSEHVTYATRAMKNMQPMDLYGKNKCTLLLMENLIEIDWIAVPCNTKILKFVICIQHKQLIPNSIIDKYINLKCLDPKKNATETPIILTKAKFDCGAKWILMKGICIRAISFGHSFVSRQKVRSECERKSVGGKIMELHDAEEDLLIVLKEWDENYPALSYVRKHDELGYVIYTKLHRFTFMPFEVRNISMSLPEGILHQVVCFKHPRRSSTACSVGLLQCSSDGSCVVPQAWCDGTKDCKDGEDEKSCYCFQHGKKVYGGAFCHNICLHDHFCSCSEMLYQCNSGGCISFSLVCDGYAHCQDQSDEICVTKEWQRNTYALLEWIKSQSGSNPGIGLNCSEGKYVEPDRINDLIPDCTEPEPNDEKLTSALLKYTTKRSVFHCKDNESLPCMPGHVRCFPRSHTGVRDRDQTGSIKYCRDAAHNYAYFPEC